MQPVKNIDLKVVNTYIMHQEVFGLGHSYHRLNYPDPEEVRVSLAFSYDYERLPADEWLFHADAMMRMIPYGQLSVRTTLQFTALPAELFSPPIIKLIIKTALEAVIKAFMNFSTQNNFPTINEMPVTDQMAGGYLQGVLDSYNNYRAPADIANYQLDHTKGLYLSQGVHTALILKGTILILDHLLFENPAFDGEHNRLAMMKHVPIERYETIRWKCIQIDKQDVQFTFMHTILFFLCLDCALQILLGDHADTLIPGIEPLGMTEPTRNEYIKHSSEMLGTIKKQWKDREVTVENLEEQIDWNSIMR